MNIIPSIWNNPKCTIFAILKRISLERKLCQIETMLQIPPDKRDKMPQWRPKYKELCLMVTILKENQMAVA